MTTLTTDSFYARRMPNGDVWIESKHTRTQHLIIVPNTECAELAQLLWPNAESDEEEWMPNYNKPLYEVDYVHRAGEPE